MQKKEIPHGAPLIQVVSAVYGGEKEGSVKEGAKAPVGRRKGGKNQPLKSCRRGETTEHPGHLGKKRKGALMNTPIILSVCCDTIERNCPLNKKKKEGLMEENLVCFPAKVAIEQGTLREDRRTSWGEGGGKSLFEKGVSPTSNHSRHDPKNARRDFSG